MRKVAGREDFIDHDLKISRPCPSRRCVRPACPTVLHLCDSFIPSVNIYGLSVIEGAQEIKSWVLLLDSPLCSCPASVSAVGKSGVFHAVEQTDWGSESFCNNFRSSSALSQVFNHCHYYRLLQGVCYSPTEGSTQRYDMQDAHFINAIYTQTLHIGPCVLLFCFPREWARFLYRGFPCIKQFI